MTLRGDPVVEGSSDPADARRLAAVLANSPIGLALVAPSGRFLEVNPALCRMLGRDEASVLAATWEELTHPEDLDADLAVVAEIMAGRRDSYQRTKRYLRPDGSVVWGNLSLSCVRRDGRAVEYVISQIVDVTEEVRLREQASESEMRFRLLAENSSDFVVLTDVAGVVQWISDSVQGVLGWAPASVIGRASAEFVDAAGLSEMYRLHDEADAGRPAFGRIQIRSKTGELRWFLRTLRAVHDANGVLVGRVMGYHDIEAEVEAEERLTESEQRYRLMAENASDVVFRGTPDRVLTWVSPSVVDVLGWDPIEMVGRPVDSFLHPEDLPSVREASRAVNEQGRIAYEARWRRADGAYRWLAILARATKDEAGVVTGRVASGRDVTAEREARQAASRSEQRFRLAMESAPVGMAVVDLDRRFVEVNPALCRMVERSEEWLLAHRVPDIVDPADDARDLQVRADVLSGRTGSNASTKRLVLADGSQIVVQHSVGLLRDEAGRPSSYVSLFVDVTEAHEAQQRLAFLASHDPLTQADNRTELLAGLRRALVRQPRTGARVGVLFIDLDGLKTVNDSLGHAAGDRIIVRVADVIRSQIRQDDHVARVGGDEFVAALVGLRSVADAEAIATNIHLALNEPFDTGGHGVTPSVSIGIAMAEEAEDVEHLLVRADRAMYVAKQAGQDGTVVFSELMMGEVHAVARRRHGLNPDGI